MTEDFKKPIDPVRSSQEIESNLKFQDKSKKYDTSNGVEEPSIEELKAAIEELKEASPDKPEKAGSPQTMPPKNLEEKGSGNPSAASVVKQPFIQAEGKIIPEIKVSEFKIELPDLTQERIKLEKALQELDVFRGKIIQRIEWLKALERKKEEVDEQLKDLHQKFSLFEKENTAFLNQIKNKLEKENEQ